MPRIPICYVTSSVFKREENIILQSMEFERGRLIRDVFDFEFVEVNIKERLEVSIEEMVRYEVKEAYGHLRIPCIVEHAGLIFEKYADKGYPGGLTNPMWNTLADDFVRETNSAGQPVIARAVIAYCDGRKVRTFAGETAGTVASEVRGGRQFYWDTVFIPTAVAPECEGRTYAEIVEDPKLGLAAKMAISQSAKAMRDYLRYMHEHGVGERQEFWVA